MPFACLCSHCKHISLAYLAICIPYSLYYSGYSCTASANARAIYKQFITYFNLSITNVLSIVVLGTFSLLTWYNLWLTRYNRHNQIQKQDDRMMLAEFTMASITTLPNFIFNIYSQITQFVKKNLN
jgi:ABC-type Fe3+ transport system permease subunit